MKITKRVNAEDVYVATKINDITNYTNLSDDTNETIDLLDDQLRNHNDFQSKDEVWEWFKHTLYLHGKQKEQFPSLYRAYLCLNTDEIFELRIADHFSNSDSTLDAWDEKGQPTIASHIAIEKMPLKNSNVDVIDKDRNLDNVHIIVDEYSLSDFNDKTKRGKKIDEIIDILKNGTNAKSFKNRNNKTDEMLSMPNKYKSIIDYINEQKYQTTYIMKSLNSYITENQAKPNKNGEYEFWAQASVIVGDHFCVKADSFEEAAKKATEIANKKIDDIPTKVGEVVEGILVWNDGTRYIQ